jgi:hypothetical protein
MIQSTLARYHLREPPGRFGALTSAGCTPVAAPDSHLVSFSFLLLFFSLRLGGASKVAARLWRITGVLQPHPLGG